MIVLVVPLGDSTVAVAFGADGRHEAPEVVADSPEFEVHPLGFRDYAEGERNRVFHSLAIRTCSLHQFCFAPTDDGHAYHARQSEAEGVQDAKFPVCPGLNFPPEVALHKLFPVAA